MQILRKSLVMSLCLFFSVGAVGCGKDSDTAPDKPLFELIHHPESGRLHIVVYPGLTDGQTLHMGVRQGSVGVLECGQMGDHMERVDFRPLEGFGDVDGDRFQGPAISPQLFSLVSYDTQMYEDWIENEPSPEMLAQIEAAFHTIDICLFDDQQVIRGAEMDIKRALDEAGSGKFDGYGNDANERIESVVAYAQACVNQMGEIPFFEPLSDGDYSTYSCIDSVAIPMTVTTENGEVTFPTTRQETCDDPQFIYSSCEPNAVTGQTNGPRVARRTNDEGTDWVILCRKALAEEGAYNDIAMIGHNPYTGKTCYFQNALYSKTDGLHVPHPADEVDSPASPAQSASLWNGIQGGIGNGIECVKCHDSDPWIHTPWIDGAKDERGEPVIPKMGVHEGYALGFNEAPYSLVDLEGQGWTMPKMLANDEAAACTKCHRIGGGRWMRSWLSRLEGEDTFWTRLLTEEGKKFEHVFWMPPEMEGINEETWSETDYGKAMKFIRECRTQIPDNLGNLPANTGTTSSAVCHWEDLPTEQFIDFGEAPTSNLEGTELALEALKVLGANVSDLGDPRCDEESGSCETRRCSECHSVSKTGLRHWAKLSAAAKDNCNLGAEPDDLSVEEALDVVNCMRATPEEADSVFAADRIGLMTTGARFSYFRKLFQKAYGEQAWLPQFIRFKSRVGMPKGTYAALSQMEHAVVMKWLDEGMPHLDTLIQDPDPPSECVPLWDQPTLAAHIEEMRYDGWEAINQESGMWMHGCPADGPATSCFSDEMGFKTRPEFQGNVGTLREIMELNFRTSFWTRSSPDGRFVANGGGVDGGSTITDLARGVDIKVNSAYDPGFFPDNTGFIFQGGGRTPICSLDVLFDENVTEVDYADPRCVMGTDINLYQHVARGLNGGDYFIINGQFTSDSGRSSDKNPVANFAAGANLKFTPMVFNGTSYEQQKALFVDSPFEGDSVLSPSGRLVISRLAGPEGVGLGYVIRKVEYPVFGDSYSVRVDQEVARVCAQGAKANISFDERFFITHTYENGASNIYIYDFKIGTMFQATNLPAGAYALFPHFRSDGWFYFLVRQGDAEWILASDAALQLAAQNP